MAHRCFLQQWSAVDYFYDVWPLLKCEHTNNGSFDLISGVENQKGSLRSILGTGWKPKVLLPKSSSSCELNMAPYATASLELMHLLGSLLLKKLDTGLMIWGVRVEPPTKTRCLIGVSLVDLGISENCLDGLKSATEEVLAQILEAGTGKGDVEVDVVEECVDFDGSELQKTGYT